jgi:NADH-quinone oxidoreductase subunit L
VTTPLSSIPLVLAGAVGPETGEAAHALTAPVEVPLWIALIPALPMLGVVLAALCAILKVRTKLPAFLTVRHGLRVDQPLLGRGAGADVHRQLRLLHRHADLLWMLFVTGLATLIALYASEYMSHDVGAGYCRFFAAFSLFVFSMACLVMGDNLLMLYLGWEGVGLCSYLLIGYFYKKPSAVAAAKKAFIVNRIGDLGLLLGILLTFVKFGTVEYAELFADGAALHRGRPGGNWTSRHRCRRSRCC